MNPIANPKSYHQATISNVQPPSPLVEVTGLDEKVKKQTSKSSGSSGGTTTNKGYDLAKFSLKVYLWRAEHFDAWPTWQKIIDDSIEKNEALEVRTPYARSGLIKATVTSVSQETPEGKGMWSRTIMFEEWTLPKPKGGAVKITAKDVDDHFRDMDQKAIDDAIAYLEATQQRLIEDGFNPEGSGA